MAFEAGFVDNLKSNISLFREISKYVKLKPSTAGKYLGCCPFHKEDTPSFYVVEKDGYYKCFGCGKSGDVISFYTDYFNTTFNEAVERIANENGIEIKQSKFLPQKPEEELEDEILHKMHEFCTTYFFNKLQGSQQALEYLKIKRRLTQETIVFFRLGYCPEGTDLTNQLIGFIKDQLVKHANVKLDINKILESSGLIYNKLPRLGGRIIFPISAKNASIIAFGGRVFKEQDIAVKRAKYINSPETAIFKKNNTLFNLANARLTSRKYIIVCEGYLDVIKLHQCGFDCAVAPMGTAINAMQIQLLLKLGKTVLFCLDSDDAGIAASFRSAKILFENIKIGQTVKFIALKNVKDVDEFLDRNSADLFENIIQNDCISLADFIWQNLRKDISFDNPDEVVKLESDIDVILASNTNKLIQKNYGIFFRNSIWRARTNKYVVKADAVRNDSKLEVMQKYLQGVVVTGMNPKVLQEIFPVETKIIEFLLKNFDYFLNQPDVFIEYSIDFLNPIVVAFYTCIERAIEEGGDVLVLKADFVAIFGNTQFGFEKILDVKSASALDLQDKSGDSTLVRPTKHVELAYQSLYLNHKLRLLQIKLQDVLKSQQNSGDVTAVISSLVQEMDDIKAQIQNVKQKALHA